MGAVEDGAAPERIEIELTEHADTGGARWRRGRHADPSPASAPSTFGGPAEGVAGDAVLVTSEHTEPPHDLAEWGTERRRLIVTALAAGVIALFVGWALGRSGGPGSSADEPSGGDVPATSGPATTDETAGSAVPSVSPDDLPATTRPFTPIVEQGPTTTEVRQWSFDTVAVDPALAASGLELVALTTNGVETVDMTSGEHGSFPGRGRNYGSPNPIVAGGDWILVYSPERQRADLFEGLAEPVDVTFRVNAQLMYEPSREVFVTVEQGLVSTRGVTMWEVRELPYDGSPATEIMTIELPTNVWVQTADPAGGVIVYAGSSGAIYHADGEGSQRLANGPPLAISATTVVTTECGETLLDCHPVVVDRASGERRQLEPPPGAPTSFEPTYGYWGMTMSSFSPTGEFISVMATDPNRWSLGLLSLLDGSFVELSQPDGDVTVAWSADGRFAFFLDNGKIGAYDTVERVMFDDVAPVAQVISFTARPATSV
jgi:hypothetical protein